MEIRTYGTKKILIADTNKHIRSIDDVPREDENGNKLKSNLESVNVDISAIETIKETQTGTAFITVDKTGDNSIIIIAGANRKS